MKTMEMQRKEAVSLLAEVDGKDLRPKERIAIPPQDMPAQDPSQRVHNMEEVAVGYAPEQVRLEAMRCLQCKTAPCIRGCPVKIDIPGFIREAAEGNFEESLAVIKRSSLLPAICGRVCPQENQCQETCTVGRSLKDVGKAVSVGRIERFVADYERKWVPAHFRVLKRRREKKSLLLEVDRRVSPQRRIFVEPDMKSWYLRPSTKREV